MSQAINESARQLGKQAVRMLVEFIGPGFHPDTKITDPESGYTDPDGKPFTDDQSWGAQRLLDFAWETLGDDIYTVGLEFQRKAIEESPK